MARRSKSHDNHEEELKGRRGPPSYPYVVYASWVPPGGELRWLILKYKDAWGARNMINSLMHNLLGGSKYELKHTQTLNWHYMQLENGMKVSLRDNEQYTKVMELDFDETEAYVSDEVQRFKYGSNYEPVRRTGDTYPEEGEDDNDGHRKRRPKSHRAVSSRTRDAKNSGRERAVRVPKESRPKVNREGMVSANDIAAELDVAGREVRGVLRSLKMVKPEGGWIFTPKEAEQLKADIRAHLKKGKK